MTELGHGSNVSDIETTAHFDSTTDEFIIHTPTETAQKFWIGGAAEDARITVTFAQLNVDGKNQGVHAFLVELRDASGNLKPGVRIKDNGPKLGLNGVDNGRIWFNNVRIPRANLLDKYCKVSPDGKYSSPIKNSSVRFATMISGLVGGRILIAGSALDACKVGLVNAIRYSLQRKQFGPSSGIEIPIMNYITHQRRLIPALATTYVIELSITKCARMFHSRTPSLMKEIHLLAAGLKAFSTWHRVETVQKCRQVVGGQGFSSYNKIAELIAGKLSL